MTNLQKKNSTVFCGPFFESLCFYGMCLFKLLIKTYLWIMSSCARQWHIVKHSNCLYTIDTKISSVRVHHSHCLSFKWTVITHMVPQLHTVLKVLPLIIMKKLCLNLNNVILLSWTYVWISYKVPVYASLTWKTMASRLILEKSLKMVSTISRNFSRCKKLGPSFSK